MANDDFLRKALESLNGRPKPPSFLPKVTPKPTVKFAPPKTVRVIRKPKVFVSFDYENDRNYRYLLQGWAANKRFDFTFQDMTPQEIQSSDIGRVKAVLTTKVQQATHTLVLVGRYANQIHPDHQKIGFRNWINFEIYQSRAFRKKIVAVKLEPSNQLPEWLNGSGATIVSRFNEQEIVEALTR